jgi:rifampin ADP-ribosylating transferase
LYQPSGFGALPLRDTALSPPLAENEEILKSMSAAATVFSQSFFHGTKAALAPGDTIVVGHQSNFAEADPLSWVYFTTTLDAAIWGAELAAGDAPQRIYVVEPTGPFEDDPNLTDKRFPGNPTMAYRSREPLRIVAEVVGWQAHPADQVRQMQDGVARLMAEGSGVIID